jgi:hypothetical protein
MPWLRTSTPPPTLADNIDWIEVPIGNYGELNPGAGQDRVCLQELGLTQALWEQTVVQMIDVWVDAFAGSGVDLSFEGTNYYLDKGDRQRMNDYAASQGLGVQHAKWHPDWDDMAVACASCWSQGKGMVDPPLRWENQVMFAIEYPDPPLWGEGSSTTLNHVEEDYWNMAAFPDLKGDVYKTRLYPRGTLGRITTENPYVQGMIQTLRDLAGKDEGNAPYAITWLRETEFDWWPKCNNFDFYLYASPAQEPRVGSSCPGLSALTTDGQAAAVYNLDAAYAPGLCPNDRVYSATCDPRYRYARATAPGQPYIYLDVAPRYRYGAGTQARIYVDYLDVGTDMIAVQWHDGATFQTRTLVKSNSRQWKTWLITANAMDLTNRFTSGATSWDFRVWDAGDGIEYISNVKFPPMNSGTVPATATPTPTRTPVGGPTRTPTPYPPSLCQGLVINEVCTNPVTTDNAPDEVIQTDSAVELFNSSDQPLDLSPYLLCVNMTCLWLEGTLQPFGYKVYYGGWDNLAFAEGGVNTIRLERAGESPLVLVDTLAIQSQTPDHCWAAMTDASPVYVERYPPTLGRGNSMFE